MKFLDRLKAHIGGLVLIKTQLYWYDIDKWDGAEGRIYLLMDVLASASIGGCSADALLGRRNAPIAASTPGPSWTPKALALLSIDGAPKWVWVYDNDVEFVK